MDPKWFQNQSEIISKSIPKSMLNLRIKNPLKIEPWSAKRKSMRKEVSNHFAPPPPGPPPAPPPPPPRPPHYSRGSPPRASPLSPDLRACPLASPGSHELPARWPPPRISRAACPLAPPGSAVPPQYLTSILPMAILPGSWSCPRACPLHCSAPLHGMAWCQLCKHKANKWLHNKLL